MPFNALQSMALPPEQRAMDPHCQGVQAERPRCSVIIVSGAPVPAPSRGGCVRALLLPLVWGRVWAAELIPRTGGIMRRGQAHRASGVVWAAPGGDSWGHLGKGSGS